MRLCIIEVLKILPFNFEISPKLSELAKRKKKKFAPESYVLKVLELRSLKSQKRYQKSKFIYKSFEPKTKCVVIF